MQNKVLVVVEVPAIERKFNVFLPINKKINNIIDLLTQAISEMTDNGYLIRGNEVIYSKVTGKKYDTNVYLKDSDLKNGSIIILV